MRTQRKLNDFGKAIKKYLIDNDLGALKFYKELGMNSMLVNNLMRFTEEEFDSYGPHHKNKMISDMLYVIEYMLDNDRRTFNQKYIDIMDAFIRDHIHQAPYIKVVLDKDGNKYVY